jgi:putative addiction module CopG family antidote
MSIYLKPEHERFIQAQIEKGEYSHPDEAIDEAFRLLKDRENCLELQFYRLAENWKYETASISSIKKKVNHQDYLRIVEMGRDVLPFILRSLLREPDCWFVALKSISQEDPILPGATFQQAVSGWLQWGREQRLI